MKTIKEIAQEYFAHALQTGDVTLDKCVAFVEEVKRQEQPVTRKPNIVSIHTYDRSEITELHMMDRSRMPLTINNKKYRVFYISTRSTDGRAYFELTELLL